MPVVSAAGTDFLRYVPDVVKDEWREKYGWRDGDPAPAVPEPDDPQPTLPVAAVPDDDIPFPEIAEPAEQAVMEAGLAPLPLATEAHARRDDPGTSHAAARSISSDELRESQRAVLLMFDRCGPMTDEEAAAVYESAVMGGVPSMNGVGMPRQSPSGLRTRRDELVTAGYLMDTGARRTLRSGRHAVVWGRTALALPL